MRSSYRGLLLAVLCAGAEGFAEPEAEYTGFITDTECGPNHAPMIAKGGMGKDDRECTLICVKKGATFGFVDADRKRFYQLDDQDAPAPYAGLRVRIRGRQQGDTISLTSVRPAEND
jgi:hypothetical protein